MDLSFIYKDKLILWLIITSVFWITKTNLFGLKFYPLIIFGETQKLNNLYLKYGQKYKTRFIQYGSFSYNIAKISIILPLVLPLLIVLYLVNAGDWVGATFNSDISFDMFLLKFLFVIGFSFFLHEMAHGLLAGSYGIKVRKTGFGLVYIWLGGAYVELETKEEQSDKKSKQSFYNNHITSAGIGSNVILFLIGLLFFVIFPSYQIFGIIMFVNLFLVIINIVPFSITDGGKIFDNFINKSKINDKFKPGIIIYSSSISLLFIVTFLFY